MLELRNIVKDYVSGNNVTHALKGVTVNFRKQEFVSILGPSGCGKTTLLNIIGGLDRYTDGDLLINGISTKEYKDRDWDTYRNHSIGFVFQTYNLISHQNILKNVELALTISGVSKEERKQRAYEALRIVGLQGMEKKKPNQLSGGQCQRVAIARALINNPEILLADEPTGALDSETSIQIMDLLKEVAKDRLVIMVTHNPDLANAYSTRIIRIFDGLLTDDSDPYAGNPFLKYKKEENSQEKPVKTRKLSKIELTFIIASACIVLFSITSIILSLILKHIAITIVVFVVSLLYLVGIFFLEVFREKDEKAIKLVTKQEKAVKKEKPQKEENSKGKKKKTSMSIWTSIGLSTSNLVSKMKRTILVTIAGSIGIIGVSAVLAVSRGVKDYIADLQNDMLSSYPLSIAEESLDYTALITGLNNQTNREKFEFDPNDPKIGVDSMISYLMSAYSDLTNVKTNTIDEKMLDFVDKMPKEDVGAVKYNYAIDPTNNIFGKWKDQSSNTEDYISFNGLTQRYIAELMTVKGFAEYASFVDLFTSFMVELPDNKDYVLDQYDVLKGEYSTNENDLMLVVDQDTTLTDVLLAQIGVFDHDSFLNIAKCAIEERDKKAEEGFSTKTQEEKDQIIQEARDKYPYNRSFTYDDLVGREYYYFPQDTIYSKDDHVADDKMSISMSFQVMKGTDIDSFVSLQYQQYLGYNLFYGTAFVNNGGTLEPKTIACVNIENMDDSSFIANGRADLKGTWYAFEPAALVGLDKDDAQAIAQAMLFMFTISDDGNQVTYMKLGMPPTIKVVIPNWTENPDPVSGYSYNAIAKNEWLDNPEAEGVNGQRMEIKGILRLKDTKRFGCLSRGLYYSKSFGEKYINDSKDAIVTKALKKHLDNKLSYNIQFDQAFVKFPFYDHKQNKMRDDGYASSLNGDLSTSFSDIFMSFSGVNYFENNAVHLRSLCGHKALINNNDDGEFESTEFKLLPREISIYPKSFSAKDSITTYLDRWNSDEVLTLNGTKYSRAQRDDLTYTDTISLIVAVIDTFINAVTIALVVFTSLSLVVSCFMIAVITYISVVERIKEIGVIRSLGGRKGDVASLFIMETLMTGLFSGMFGVTMTYLLQIIVNIILVAKFGIAIMNLTVWTALLMIGISVALSVLSGLIPSQSAAHKDPVVALRSNE